MQDELNVNVNSSVWEIIRHQYWWEAALLVPLFITWEILLFLYVGPAMFGPHSGSSNGRGFATLVILPVAVAVAWFHRLQKKVEDQFLAQFALSNGYTYEAQGIVDETYGSIFQVEGTQTVSDIVTGSFNNQALRLFLYDLTHGSGRNQKVYRNTVLEITLPGKVPAMLLSTKRFNTLGMSIVAASGIHNSILLEGDFNKYFTLYTPEGTQIEALEVFAPNLMAILEDNSRGYDVEFIANKIYIYLNKYVNTSADLNQLFSLAKLLISNVGPVAARLAHDSAILSPSTNLTLPRVRGGNRRARIIFGIAAGVLILVGIGLSFVSSVSTPPLENVSSSNPAYAQAAAKAEADLASSTQSAPLGAQIVRDGQAALAAAQTKFGRSGAYYYIGMGYFWQADYQQGLINENQSLVEDPADQAAIITGSELLINLGRNQEAITLIERALATDTKNSTALRTRSFAYANLGKRAQALTDIDTATSIDQSDPKKAVNLSYDTLDRSLVVGAERPLKFYP